MGAKIIIVVVLLLLLVSGGVILAVLQSQGKINLLGTKATPAPTTTPTITPATLVTTTPAPIVAAVAAASVTTTAPTTQAPTTMAPTTLSPTTQTPTPAPTQQLLMYPNADFPGNDLTSFAITDTTNTLASLMAAYPTMAGIVISRNVVWVKSAFQNYNGNNWTNRVSTALSLQAIAGYSSGGSFTAVTNVPISTILGPLLVPNASVVKSTAGNLDCSGGACTVSSGNQTFTFNAANNNAMILSNGACMDLNAWNSADGATIDQWSCNNGANESWIPTWDGAGFVLKNPWSNKCAAPTNAGVKLATCNGTAAQRWYT